MKCIVSNTQCDNEWNTPPNWTVIPLTKNNYQAIFDLMDLLNTVRRKSLTDIEIHAYLPECYFTDSDIVLEALDDEDLYGTDYKIVDIDLDVLREEVDQNYQLCSGRIFVDERGNLIAYHMNNRDWQSSAFEFSDMVVQ